MQVQLLPVQKWLGHARTKHLELHTACARHEGLLCEWCFSDLWCEIAPVCLSELGASALRDLLSVTKLARLFAVGGKCEV
jgi:hypothetical protein